MHVIVGYFTRDGSREVEMANIDDKSIEKQRLLSSEDGEVDNTPRVHFQRLPAGVWFIEWVGVLSRVNPIRKKKLYVVIYCT